MWLYSTKGTTARRSVGSKDAGHLFGQFSAAAAEHLGEASVAGVLSKPCKTRASGSASGGAATRSNRHLPGRSPSATPDVGIIQIDVIEVRFPTRP